ncbi:MAG TPA: iron siderophore-binding protein [Nostoc sp. UBA8866]|nr:iron siderophore-binding protein [Nostoc sp. UBA8866]
MTLVFVLVTGCYSHPNQNIQSANSKPVTSECRIIKHPLGETCIPLHPQRIIAMDEDILEILVALDLKPIAVAINFDEWSSREKQLWQKAEGIDSIVIGNHGILNLEKMLLLKPDLILGLAESTDRKSYELFSQIAPTVTVDYAQTAWRDVLLRVGNIIGKTEQAQKLIAEFQQRIEKLRVIVKNKLGKTKISVVRVYNYFHKTIEFRSNFSFPGSLLVELGLSFPEKQNQIPTSPGFPFVFASLERLDLLDADVMFVTLDAGGEENFKKFQASPLWQKLKAVKNNCVYTVDSGYWIFGNIMSANAILDDLDKYLLQQCR